MTDICAKPIKAIVELIHMVMINYLSIICTDEQVARLNTFRPPDLSPTYEYLNLLNNPFISRNEQK